MRRFVRWLTPLRLIACGLVVAGVCLRTYSTWVMPRAEFGSPDSFEKSAARRRVKNAGEVATHVAAALLLGEFLVQRRRRRRRAAKGLCLTCGYDLTGNASGVCPECGSAVAKGVKP